jgi:hypothetical protein
MKNLGVNMGSKRIVYKIHITFFNYFAIKL